MGAAKSSNRNAGSVLQGTESAREVLTRRAAAVSREPVIKVNGSPNNKKPVFNEYNREAMEEMSKIFTVKTSIGKVNSTQPDGSHVAQIIRYHRDNNVESNLEKGIVQGRAQLKEEELVALFSAFRNDPGIVGEISMDLNTSLDESLALMRSVRLPKFAEVGVVH
mmetsp:Transcript_7911/g.13340  ORF Transcript_7911/g.13340 Transcript_7911/m.13340 type:complete len:165 (-) Transcript_7911:2235-2729(-)